MIPPVGAYETRWASIDSKVSAPLYGTHDTWGGSHAKQARKIREVDFANKAQPCGRLDRTLVYRRNGAMSSNRGANQMDSQLQQYVDGSYLPTKNVLPGIVDTEPSSRSNDAMVIAEITHEFDNADLDQT